MKIVLTCEKCGAELKAIYIRSPVSGLRVKIPQCPYCLENELEKFKLDKTLKNHKQ